MQQWLIRLESKIATISKFVKVHEVVRLLIGLQDAELHHRPCEESGPCATLTRIFPSFLIVVNVNAAILS